ncbi:MAG: endonuclease/exonuclease/phosphatase family metal-dependent hydrolase [Saprospiraceae bacterium]|jgi:endonuclease/exonuclease/phosphatase family metal-dependent hydrolase
MKPFCNTVLILAIIAFSLGACKQTNILELRVMSYNIKHGVGMDGVLDLSRSSSLIKSISPDICGLQEIDNYCERSDSIGQVEYISQKTSLQGTFGKFMEYQGGEYGMATLSGKPILSTRKLKLPDGIYEPRISLVHELELANECIITFSNVHFDWIEGEEGSAARLAQAMTLVKYIDSLGRGAIIIGDFNCTPNSPTMSYFKEQGFVFAEKGDDNLSFQGEEKGEIDHFIYRDSEKEKFQVKSIELLVEPLVSDHRPLVVEVEVSY